VVAQPSWHKLGTLTRKPQLRDDRLEKLAVLNCTDGRCVPVAELKDAVLEPALVEICVPASVTIPVFLGRTLIPGYFRIF
jgi:hypothetical protein